MSGAGYPSKALDLYSGVECVSQMDGYASRVGARSGTGLVPYLEAYAGVKRFRIFLTVWPCAPVAPAAHRGYLTPEGKPSEAMRCGLGR